MIRSAHPWRLRCGLSLGMGFLSLGVTWLFVSERSPFYQYFIWHVELPNRWVRLNIYPMFLGIAFSGNIHQGSLLGYVIGMLLQWGAVGLVVGLLVVRRSKRKPGPPFVSETGGGRRRVPSRPGFDPPPPA